MITTSTPLIVLSSESFAVSIKMVIDRELPAQRWGLLTYFTLQVWLDVSQEDKASLSTPRITFGLIREDVRLSVGCGLRLVVIITALPAESFPSGIRSRSLVSTRAYQYFLFRRAKVTTYHRRHEQECIAGEIEK